MPAAEPIHQAPVDGVSVRFYAPPNGQSDLPWHSFTDLCAAARLPHAARDELLRKARSHADVGIVTLANGTVVESHHAAIALIGAMISICAVPPSFAEAYAAAGIEALEVLHAGLSDREVFERLKAIAQTTCGVELGLPS